MQKYPGSAIYEVMCQVPVVISASMKVPGTAAWQLSQDRLVGVGRKRLSLEVVTIPVGHSSEELCQVEFLVKELVNNPGEVAAGV